jgi:hypothetical protein
VIDFEDWNGVWEETHPSYQNASIQIVREQYPSWSVEQVTAQAQTDFETAAVAFLVATVTRGKELRPKCRWGWYGYPCAPAACLGAVKCTNNSRTGVPECGFDDPVQGERFRALATVVQPVLDKSDAVFPRIYLSPNGDDCRQQPPAPSVGCTPAETAAWIRALVSEAARLMRHRVDSVFPYIWQWYSGPLNADALSDTDRHIVMTAPYDAGAAGVVIWVDAEAQNHPKALREYATTKTGPEAQVDRQPSLDSLVRGPKISVSTGICFAPAGVRGGQLLGARAVCAG